MFQDEIFSFFRCCSISISLWYLGVVAAGVRYELAEFHNPIIYVVTPPPLHLVVCGSPRTASLNKNGSNKFIVLLVGKTNKLIPVSITANFSFFNLYFQNEITVYSQVTYSLR